MPCALISPKARPAVDVVARDLATSEGDQRDDIVDNSWPLLVSRSWKGERWIWRDAGHKQVLRRQVVAARRPTADVVVVIVVIAVDRASRAASKLRHFHAKAALSWLSPFRASSLSRSWASSCYSTPPATASEYAISRHTRSVFPRTTEPARTKRQRLGNRCTWLENGTRA